MKLVEFRTIRDICEKIFQIETEHGLLDLEVDGVKIWQFLRMSIYYEIAVSTGVLSPPRQRLLGRKVKLVKIFRSLGNLFFRNPLFCRKEIDVLILPHARKMDFEGEWIDIYSHYLMGQVEASGRKCLLLEDSWNGGGPGLSASLHTDVFCWMNFFKRLGGGLIRDEEEQGLRELDRLLNESFCTEIDFYSKFVNRLPTFRLNYIHYKKLLKRLRPKLVYVVVAYSGWCDLIKAAKDLGVKVVEIQHGVFSRYHLGYSFPNCRVKLEYFPDQLLTWGQYWADMEELPLSKSDRLIAGFDYFHRKREMLSCSSRNKSQILVLSQGAVSHRLADVMSVLCRELPDYQFIYKLHPSEYPNWKNNSSLVDLFSQPNVTIVAENADIYRLLAVSQYQFGVFSTAIFEGIGMGCKTVLLDLPGVEYMERMIEMGLCVKHNDGSDIRETIGSAENIDIEFAYEFLFGSLSLKNRSTFYAYDNHKR